MCKSSRWNQNATYFCLAVCALFDPIAALLVDTYVPLTFVMQVSDALLEKWLNLLNVAMGYHNEDTEVSECSCKFLSQLLSCYPALHARIGDKENQ